MQWNATVPTYILGMHCHSEGFHLQLRAPGSLSLLWRVADLVRLFSSTGEMALREVPAPPPFPQFIDPPPHITAITYTTYLSTVYTVLNITHQGPTCISSASYFLTGTSIAPNKKIEYQIPIPDRVYYVSSTPASVRHFPWEG